MKYEIIENFLDDDKFKYLTDIINQNTFNWNISNKPNKNATKDNQIQLVHVTHEYGVAISNFAAVLIPPIMNAFMNHKNYNKLYLTRAKINCFIKSSEHIPLGFHKDILDEEDFKTLLLYLDTNNGYTEFETGEKIPTVKNSALIFDANISHQTVTQTDSMFRKNININYKEI